MAFFTTPLVPEGGFPLACPTSMIKSFGKSSGLIFGPAMVLFQGFMMRIAPEQVTATKLWVRSYLIPMSRELPLMDPIDILFCIVMYAVGLLFFYFLGKFMGKRDCRIIGIIYNSFLVLLSAYMAVGFGWLAVASGYKTLWNNGCNFTSSHAEAMRNMFWIFMVSKLFEYTDTFVMLLKHNYRQLSFLHLFHHSSVLLVAYMWIAVAPCGDGYWCPMVNSGIHIFMYLYYLLNLLYKTGPIRNFLQANKLLITYGQLTQFVFNFIQAVYILYVVKEPKYPRMLMQVSFWYMIMMLILFGNFMMKTKAATHASGDAKKDGKPRIQKEKKNN